MSPSHWCYWGKADAKAKEGAPAPLQAAPEPSGLGTPVHRDRPVNRYPLSLITPEYGMNTFGPQDVEVTYLDLFEA